ncbi:hypothetical protein CTI14_45270, partial [Methylobacterium radiotolerans]
MRICGMQFDDQGLWKFALLRSCVDRGTVPGGTIQRNIDDASAAGTGVGMRRCRVEKVGMVGQGIDESVTRVEPFTKNVLHDACALDFGN